MGNIITSKNSWELLLSSIAGAFDGADTFVLGTFDEAENYKYKTIITNHRTNEEISKYITAIKLTVPDSGDKISSIKATFDLEDLIVKNDDYVTIKILNSNESAEITILKGKAKILNRSLNKINTSNYSIEIVDELNKLFEKVVAEDLFLFDKYIYSEQYKENSILYIIAKKLGFKDEQMNFEDVRDSQSRLVKIPFMLLRKDNRYVDELQTLLDATKGRMHIDNMDQIVFQNGLFEYDKAIAYPFDVRNILRSVEENYKYTEKNGVRVTYDSYKYLANQVIFDLANKVEVAPGTTSVTAKEFVIKFITDLATQHNITKAEGYYYENEEQIRIPLLLGINYELIEFSETSAKVKFLNPYTTKFYIDKFEIKGIPLAMFSDNEVSVKATKDMLENEENFSSYNKNKYIQTEELASDIARVEYIRNCKNKKEYSFKSNFVPHLEPGDICSIKINDIDTLIQISTIEHTLSRVNGFYSEIVALEYEKIEQEFNYSKIESLTAKDSFLGTLNNIKDKVDETDKKLEEVILIEGARGFVSEADPILEREIKEPDVWFHPETKEFKVWRNGKWNPAREEDIPPALMTALKAQAGIFRTGGNDTEAGIFFQYDKDTKNPVFGATDPENLAQVSIDKNANVLIRNANNKLAFNMRNPENPSEIISQLLMGVYNADDTERHKNTLFQVGDESTGSYIKFERGKLTNVIDGKDIGETVNNIEKGNLTINANTTFDGKATFISAGSDETTIIRDGSITFTRNGQDITVIRNMRSGVIATDSVGSGVIEFTGMKTNLTVMTTIKSFNISQNIRSLHCWAEMIDISRNRWKFVIGGTEASTSGHNVTKYGSSFSQNCYSVSLGSMKVWASSNVLYHADRIGYSPGVVGSKCIVNVKVTYNDGQGSSRVIYSQNHTVGLSSRTYRNGIQNCNGAGGNPTPEAVYGLYIDSEPMLLNINQTFSTFNTSNKQFTITISNASNVATISTSNCGRKATYDVAISAISINNFETAIAYTIEQTQNLTGTGEVQYIAIEQ